MKLSEELLLELQPICVRFFSQLIQHAFPLIWTGELTLNQMRVNNSVYTRQMLEGDPSTVSQICDDLGIPRTTVTRALQALKKSSPQVIPDTQPGLVAERPDPDDDRKRLYLMPEGSENAVQHATDNLTRLLIATAIDMLPILRKHGAVQSDHELLSFVTQQLPQLVQRHLDNEASQGQTAASRDESSDRS